MGNRGVAAIGVALVVAVAGSVATMATPACTTHACDYNEVDYGNFDDPGVNGTFVGDVWESTPIDADWLDFKSERRFVFYMPASFRGTRRPLTMLAYLAEVQHPVTSDFTNPEIIALASGNAAEMTWDDARANITVHNGTCQEYFLRLVVTFEPAPTPPDASAPDGNLEGGLDGSPDAVQDGPIGVDGGAD